ncbi:hypothetical protein ACHAWX_001938 [Stephanocyclus meneghinianus]
MADLAPRSADSVGTEEVKMLRSRVELLEKAVCRHQDEAVEQHQRTSRPTAFDADEEMEDVSFMNASVTNNVDTFLPTAINDDRLKSSLHDAYELPESTFTLLITHNIFSVPFFTGLIASALALMCLVLVFINELDKGTIDNPFSLPAGVTTEVRMAQFVGVLMEEEIPLGLEIIGKGIKQDESRRSRVKLGNIFFSCILRLTVGYFFLLTLFLTVIQESDVLAIFFDVLVFELCKRGFFGHILKSATEHGCQLVCKKSRDHTNFKAWMNRFIRLIYFLNAGLMVAGLSILMVKQNNGEYRCKSFSVYFGDDSWEDAWVELDNGDMEKRLLVYAHFNGIYVGKPRYVEQNKEDGLPFRSTIPAEIVYCEDAESWVFRHEKISTTLGGKGDEKESYDLVEMAQKEYWSMWKGVVVKNYEVYITCNECRGSSDCNYHGHCTNQKCHCDHGFYGISCEHESPCEVLLSSKDNTTALTLMKDFNDDTVNFVEIYGRPTYFARNMTGKPYDDNDEFFSVFYNSTITDNSELIPHKHFHRDDFGDDDFFQINNSTSSFQELLRNYTFVLWYSGRRWYGQIWSQDLTLESFVEEEFHAFWANSFSGVGSNDNKTLIISDPSSQGSPEGLSFYEMRRRNLPGTEASGYGPFGVLIPLIGAEDAGFFRCIKEGGESSTRF